MSVVLVVGTVAVIALLLPIIITAISARREAAQIDDEMQREREMFARAKEAASLLLRDDDLPDGGKWKVAGSMRSGQAGTYGASRISGDFYT